MTDKKTQPLKPAPGPEKHPEIPDSVHTAASQVARNLLNSPTKTQEGIVRERQAKYGRKERQADAHE